MALLYGGVRNRQGRREMAEGLAARRGALGLLQAVLGEGRMLTAAAEALAPSDRARAERLAAQVLRQMDRADRVLAPFLRKAPPLPVQNALRLAVVELAEGAAAHGVVNAAVALVREMPRQGHLGGMVNAVLRRVSDAPPDFAALPVPMLPRWLRQPLVHAWGREAVAGIEAVQAQVPPLDLTLRPGAVPPPGAVALPGGSWRLPPGGQVTALPGWAEGAFWVQDAGAAVAARVLAPQPGERVVDLCAAPGGKTLQLAAAGAQVTAVDISDARLARLRDNLARCGLVAEVVAADALDWQPQAPADAVLLDAPCSATGTIRRHPDLPRVKDGSDLPALVALQAALIDRALAMLRPGGRLVYATCSLLPEEGEAQIRAALARHPGLLVEPPETGDPRWPVAEGLRIRPDHWAETGGIDGFFVARLRRPG
jgi:16S rRNA (cytosine967-C5)-methyltransferase